MTGSGRPSYAGPVFDSFHMLTRRVIVTAQEEARGRGHAGIGTEHLLRALLRYEGPAADLLAELGVAPDTLAGEVDRVMGRTRRRRPTGHLPLIPAARTVLDLAVQESQRLGHPLVGTDDLLLGLVAEGGGAAGRVLRAYGVDLARVRQAAAAVDDRYRRPAR